MYDRASQWVLYCPGEVLRNMQEGTDMDVRHEQNGLPKVTERTEPTTAPMTLDLWAPESALEPPVNLHENIDVWERKR